MNRTILLRIEEFKTITSYNKNIKKTQDSKVIKTLKIKIHEIIKFAVSITASFNN